MARKKSIRWRVLLEIFCLLNNQQTPTFGSTQSQAQHVQNSIQ